MKLIRLFTAGVAASMFIACGTADTESPKPNDTPPPGNMMTPPPPPPEPIAVTKQSLKEIFQKNLTTALKGLATTEDITREMKCSRDSEFLLLGMIVVMKKGLRCRTTG